MSQLLISQKQRDQICVMLESLKPEFGSVGSRDVEVRMRRDDVDLIISTLSALTQPASPALKLPDGWVVVPVEPNWEMLSADGCKEHHNGQTCLHHDNRLRIWAAMLAAAPVPHTAPIEPICATGGAEWVKPVPRELQQVLLELRTYNPKADEYGGKHIIPGWADRIEKALGIKPAATEEE